MQLLHWHNDYILSTVLYWKPTFSRLQTPNVFENMGHQTREPEKKEERKKREKKGENKNKNKNTSAVLINATQSMPLSF